MTMRQISFIRIYWDASDPQDPGWAWRAYHDPGDGALPYELESGALPSINRRAGQRTLVPQARQAAGCRGHRVPVEIVE